MNEAELEEQIQTLQKTLISETEKYRVAMNIDSGLYEVKSLYQKLKATSRQLKLLMIKYEEGINNQMRNYDKLKSDSNKNNRELIN